MTQETEKKELTEERVREIVRGEIGKLFGVLLNNGVNYLESLT